MNYYAVSDEKIAAELGQRFRHLRQRRGYSKQELADAMDWQLDTITALEKGNGDLMQFIALLRKLGAFHQLDRFLTDARVRSLEMNDPRVPTQGTVMYRRRKHDFKPGSEKSEQVAIPKRLSDMIGPSSPASGRNERNKNS